MSHWESLDLNKLYSKIQSNDEKSNHFSPKINDALIPSIQPFEPSSQGFQNSFYFQEDILYPEWEPRTLRSQKKKIDSIIFKKDLKKKNIFLDSFEIQKIESLSENLLKGIQLCQEILRKSTSGFGFDQ